MKWNKFAAEVHQDAVDHGWWEPKPSVAQIVVMCHSELSEAVEEYRAGRPMVYCDVIRTNAACTAESCGGLECLKEFPVRKPEGVAVEMADCILRILDYLAAEEVNIDGKLALGLSYLPDDLAVVIAKCHALISKAYLSLQESSRYAYLLDCMEIIMDWAHLNAVDMEAVLRTKHEYNKTRPFRHGGKAL